MSFLIWEILRDQETSVHTELKEVLEMETCFSRSVRKASIVSRFAGGYSLKNSEGKMIWVGTSRLENEVIRSPSQAFVNADSFLVSDVKGPGVSRRLFFSRLRSKT
jgi:hypothetical protein